MASAGTSNTRFGGRVRSISIAVSDRGSGSGSGSGNGNCSGRSSDSVSVSGNGGGGCVATNNIPRSPLGCQRLRLPSFAAALRQTRGASEYAAISHHTSSSSSCSSSCRRNGSGSQIRKEQRRVVVMGSAGVGKTCIISQFLYDKFLPRYKQTVEELHRGEYDLPDGSALTLDILDTSGSFEFPAMRTLSISTAGAFMLVYAVNDAESWNEVERLRNQIINARGLNVPIVVVGNKIDLNEEERRVQYEVTEMVVCEDWKCGYVECSAKENSGILDVFKELLVQANIRYNLSPAVRRRRQSLPSYTTSKHQQKNTTRKFSLKRHSCTMS